MRVLSFGEILWDVYPDAKYIGGASLNFAGHMAKHNADTFLYTAVGNDDLGHEALSCLQKLGISQQHVAILDNQTTGRCVVTIDEQAIPQYDLLNDVAYDHIPLMRPSGNFDVLYYGTLALRNPNNLAVLKRLLAENTFSEVFADVNIRPPFYTRETVQFAVENATILKISLEELPIMAALLSGAQFPDHSVFAAFLAEHYPNLKCILITLGADGVYALDCTNRKSYACNAVQASVSSTVGAGDSFSAAFLYAYMVGRDITRCLQHATAVAGYVVSQYDAVPDYNLSNFSL